MILVEQFYLRCVNCGILCYAFCIAVVVVVVLDMVGWLLWPFVQAKGNADNEEYRLEKQRQIREFLADAEANPGKFTKREVLFARFPASFFCPISFFS